MQQTTSSLAALSRLVIGRTITNNYCNPSCVAVNTNKTTLHFAIRSQFVEGAQLPSMTDHMHIACHIAQSTGQLIDVAVTKCRNFAQSSM